MHKHTIRYYAVLSLLISLWGASIATGALVAGAA